VTDYHGDALNLTGLFDSLATSVEEKPLMKMSMDVTSLPVASPSNSEAILFDSDGSEDPSFSQEQPLADSGRDEQIMLLDADDDGSSIHVPCLIPEAISPSSSLLSKSVNDQTVLASDIPADAVSASILNGSVEEPAQSQMFDFGNDMIRSSSPNSGNTSTTLPYLRSRTAKKGSD